MIRATVTTCPACGLDPCADGCTFGATELTQLLADEAREYRSSVEWDETVAAFGELTLQEWEHGDDAAADLAIEQQWVGAP